MVWALFPIDSIPGEDKYYIFTKGAYKVGRKGCDVIINKDKGVSRVHAEILVDAMTSFYPHQSKSSIMFSEVRILDCSKYGTFIKREPSSSKEKVHELPNRETTLKDGDVISFGTGNATYRFCLAPLMLLLYCSEPSQMPNFLQERVSSIGASMTSTLSADCTHVLVEQSMPVTELLVDIIVAKKPVVLSDWIETIAGKRIQNDIPSYFPYVPIMTLEGLSVKIVDPVSRQKCLVGYTFVLDSAYKYKFGDKFQPLLEVGGAKVAAQENFCSSSQGLVDEEYHWVVHVIPASEKLNSKISSLTRINELDLICAVLSGDMNPSLVLSPSLVISSSCSTDETIVADSDVEIETTSLSQRAAATDTSVNKSEANANIFTDDAAAKSETGHGTSFIGKNDVMTAVSDDREEPDSGSEIIYSQDLVVRNATMPASVCSREKNGVVNFKSFRKARTLSGNSFNNLIPFSIHPYKDSDCENQLVESVKEEKKRKQMERISEDLFNSEKGRRRTATSSLRGFLSRG